MRFVIHSWLWLPFDCLAGSSRLALHLSHDLHLQRADVFAPKPGHPHKVSPTGRRIRLISKRVPLHTLHDKLLSSASWFPNCQENCISRGMAEINDYCIIIRIRKRNKAFANNQFGLSPWPNFGDFMSLFSGIELDWPLRCELPLRRWSHQGVSRIEFRSQWCEQKTANRNPRIAARHYPH